ncbi:MAG: hypothetical protein KF781_08360 [Chitinophagaceae bacterium]|nr:hypothetical protein [Chitinophagaceae bacterium]MCW5905769.1 hypothetical protein [Chitinophagaceae bacterium]
MLGLQQAGIKLIVYIDKLLGITYIFTPVPFVIIWLIDKVFYKNNWVKEVDDSSNK